jgi:hypothetical protein
MTMVWKDYFLKILNISILGSTNIKSYYFKSYYIILDILKILCYKWIEEMDSK